MKKPTNIFLIIFCLAIINCKNTLGEKDSDNIENHPSNIAPPNAAHPTAYVDFKLPPDGFTAAIPMLDVVLDTKSGSDSAIVKIHRIALYAVINGNDSLLLCEDTYDESDAGWKYFGLWPREPWFLPNDDKLPMTVFYNEPGFIEIHPNRSDRIWHLWATDWPRPLVPPEAQSIWAVVNIEILGDALVRAAIDYHRTPTSDPVEYGVDNIEMGGSDWIGKAQGIQTLYVGK